MDHESTFKAWASAFGRNYSSEEEPRKFMVWLDNLNTIASYNSKEEIMAMNREYTQTKFPVVKALPWKVVFSGVTYENKPVPQDGIDLISQFLIFTPHRRSNGFDALTHPYFDELRQPNYSLPSGKPTPPLFNFTDDEIQYAKSKGIAHKVLPKHLWNEYGLIDDIKKKKRSFKK